MMGDSWMAIEFYDTIGNSNTNKNDGIGSLRAGNDTTLDAFGVVDVDAGLCDVFVLRIL